MTAVTFTSTPSGTQTLATFKGWAQGFHDGLIAVGLVQTADTGQISFPAITALPAASTNPGYGIYRFNDASQSATPLFLRVDYRLGASSRPNLLLTLSKGTDGAGAAVGLIDSWSAPVTNSAASAVDSFISCGAGYLTIALWSTLTTTSAGGIFVVERTRDMSDAPTGGGLIVAYSTAISTYRYSDLASLSHTGNLQMPVFAATRSMGLGVTPVFPLPVALASGQASWQPLCMLAVPPPDRPLSPFAVTINGVVRTYLAPVMAGFGSIAGAGNTANIPSGTAILFE